jgi:hypothetical protein
MRKGLSIIGATTVVEDAQGIPGKVDALIAFIQGQPALLYYGSLIILISVGTTLVVPASAWIQLRKKSGSEAQMKFKTLEELEDARERKEIDLETYRLERRKLLPPGPIGVYSAGNKGSTYLNPIIRNTSVAFVDINNKDSRIENLHIENDPPGEVASPKDDSK